jgi:hypothetical protein
MSIELLNYFSISMPQLELCCEHGLDMNVLAEPLHVTVPHTYDEHNKTANVTQIENCDKQQRILV